MKDEERLVCNRLLDMANSCYYRNIPVTTDFWDLNSQSLFHGIIPKLPDVKWVMEGGYEMAERKIITFLPSYCDADMSPKGYSIIKILPLNRKFCEELTHRDYLGAILNLGITRNKIGDIIVTDEAAYFFCIDAIQDYVVENLTKIKHTIVQCFVINDMEFNYEPKFKEIKGSIASLRLDSVIALGFKDSRSHIITYIEEGKTAVNGRIITSNAYLIKPNDIISVRGLGKLKFISELSATHKGRLMVMIHKYI